MRSRRLYRALVVGAAALVLAVALVAYGFHGLRRLDLNSVDWRFDIRGSQGPPANLVLVKIDDVTFSDLGVQWPFPRRLHARVIRNLKRAGAKVIAMDIQFTEQTDNADDYALASASRAAGNVVLATTEITAHGKTDIFGGGAGLAYSRATPGYSNFPNDPGGTIRRTALRVQGLDTFPVAIARRALGHRVAFPGGPGATPWVDFAGPPGTVRSISYSDVLRDRFPASLVRGKIVVVGATAPSLQDLHPTSTTGVDPMPGPEIQANAAETVLRGFPLGSAPGWIDVVLIVVLALAAPLLALRISAVKAILVSLLLVAALLVSVQLAFDAGTIVGFVYAVLAAIASGVLTLALYGITTAFERERVRDTFARFVPESVVGEVLNRADGLRLGGVRGEGTLLFSDLRGFTSFAERRDPDEVIAILNRYLTEMSDAILSHGGTLVSYMGDGIMAVFGAPLPQRDHADRAVAAAREMLERLERFNAWMRQAGHGDGFKMGVGLNTGPFMSGNVGSERRLEYTTIGDTTNTAARLEGMTKGTPYQLYVADSTRAALVEEVELVAAGEFEVRGRTTKITVWTVPGTEAPQPQAAAIAPPAEAVPTPAGAEGPA